LDRKGGRKKERGGKGNSGLIRSGLVKSYNKKKKRRGERGGNSGGGGARTPIRRREERGRECSPFPYQGKGGFRGKKGGTLRGSAPHLRERRIERPSYTIQKRGKIQIVLRFRGEEKKEKGKGGDTLRRKYDKLRKKRRE